jgi:farnesyl-diphosphate farnesyltransferase
MYSYYQLGRLIHHLQIGTAWFFGARFDNIFKEASVFLPGGEKATPLVTGRDEL